MDRQRGEGFAGEKKKRSRVGKSVSNYLSQNAKENKLYGLGGNNDDDPFAGQDGSRKRGKCHEFCCIVFCCMDANIYYGEEKYQKIMMKANEVDHMKMVEETKNTEQL